jgi:Ca2+ transporting ATPase
MAGTFFFFFFELVTNSFSLSSSLSLPLFIGQIGKIGLAAAILTFLALTIFWAVRSYGQEKMRFKAEQLVDLLTFFIVSVTIVVVAVPEGKG